MFELTSTASDGAVRRVYSGYRPIYDVLPDYWTSVHHEFVNTESVASGEKARAEVWFLSPEAYPHSLWHGRSLKVAEGSRVVASATVLQVFNPLLLKNAG
jgi:hypothetical protein